MLCTFLHSPPLMSNVNKSSNVYPVGFHLKFIYNYDCHRFCVSMVRFYASSCFTVVLIVNLRLTFG